MRNAPFDCSGTQAHASGLGVPAGSTVEIPSVGPLVGPIGKATTYAGNLPNGHRKRCRHSTLPTTPKKDEVWQATRLFYRLPFQRSHRVRGLLQHEADFAVAA